MSHDSVTRHTPPDFGDDDDENKDDQQMFVSATLAPTDDVPLDEEEDEEEEDNPFGAPSPSFQKKTPLATANELAQNDLASTLTQESQPSAPLNPEMPSLVNEKSISSIETSIESSTVPLDSPSSTGPRSLTNETTTATATKPVPKQSKEHNIEIMVSDPTKVGEGMSSYMTYRISTKTSMAMFKKPEFSVNRRFSDFLGLHNRLVHKHLQLGVIIPSPPEKDSFSMAKVKISKEEAIPTDFIDRRRSQLERYLNRLARHEKLVQDPDFREFIEMPTDLPKSSNTQALSGAGVLRALSNISNQVTKLTSKTGEQDQWFEEKYTFIVDLHAQFKQLYNHLNSLFTHQKEAGQALKSLSTSLNHLATIEEHTLLSSALIELANVQDKLDQIQLDHSLKEFGILTELIKEYLSLVEMVQLAFQERSKMHQQWLYAEDTLKKKRETKSKLEQTPKSADKLPQAEMEINEWESKVERGKDDFERISTSIKQELDVFEQTRIEDFQKAIEQYLKQFLEKQEKVLEVWEHYLPEANKISV